MLWHLWTERKPQKTHFYHLFGLNALFSSTRYSKDGIFLFFNITAQKFWITHLLTGNFYNISMQWISRSLVYVRGQLLHVQEPRQTDNDTWYINKESALEKWHCPPPKSTKLKFDLVLKRDSRWDEAPGYLLPFSWWFMVKPGKKGVGLVLNI